MPRRKRINWEAIRNTDLALTQEGQILANAKKAGYSTRDIAERIGVGVYYVKERIHLMSELLSDEVRRMTNDGDIPLAYALELLQRTKLGEIAKHDQAQLAKKHFADRIAAQAPPRVYRTGKIPMRSHGAAIKVPRRKKPSLVPVIEERRETPFLSTDELRQRLAKHLNGSGLPVTVKLDLARRETFLQVHLRECLMHFRPEVRQSIDSFLPSPMPMDVWLKMVEEERECQRKHQMTSIPPAALEVKRRLEGLNLPRQDVLTAVLRTMRDGRDTTGRLHRDGFDPEPKRETHKKPTYYTPRRN